MSDSILFPPDDLVGLLNRTSSLVGGKPPEVPVHLRLYPDSQELLWYSCHLLRRQKSLEDRSALVHLLLQQLQLLLDFDGHVGQRAETFQVEDLTFTLDASEPIRDNARKYKFDLVYPARGTVEVQERLEYGRHRWRYYMQLRPRDGAVEIRDVSDAVGNFSGRRERGFVDGREVVVTHVRAPYAEGERQLEI